MSKDIKDILKLYERKRDLAQEELEYRIKDVYNQVPLIKEIDDKINRVGMQSMRLALQNPSKKDELLLETKIKLDELKKEKEEVLRKYRVPEGYLEMQYECNICKDKGFLGNGSKCNCLKQAIINNSYSMSNIASSLQKHNFSTFDLSLFSDEIYNETNKSPKQNMEEILSISESFIFNFSKDDNSNLLFYGDTGIGKTFMCSCIAKSLLDKGKTVIYQTAFKMFDILEGYKFNKNNSDIKREDYENLFNCDLLIIDDLGTELVNSFTTGELFNILNTRMLEGKKTIISTNLSPMQIAQTYSQRIFSRIFGNFKMIKFIGPDLRWEKTK